MKAITLYQPWASLWLTDAKRTETRPRRTNHVGPLLVHAGKKVVTDPDVLGDDLIEIIVDLFGPDWADTLPRGALIGIVDLIGYARTEEFVGTERDRVCGDHRPGRFAWIRRDGIRLIEKPIPWRGCQAMFDVPDEELQFRCSPILTPRYNLDGTHVYVM